MATCLDYACVPLPAHCLGISARGAAEQTAGAPVRSHAYGENRVSRMIVNDTWKYVRYTEGANAEQLYDLTNDPGETRNHAGDPANAAVLAALRARLDEEIAAHAALALGPISEKQGGE